MERKRGMRREAGKEQEEEWKGGEERRGKGREDITENQPSPPGRVPLQRTTWDYLFSTVFLMKVKTLSALLTSVCPVANIVSETS
jgi:hypothetical protein